jgi:membrane-associated two-gene conflict system component 1 (EACC1)
VFGYRIGMPTSPDSGDPSRVEIVLAGDDPDAALRDLRAWLRDDEELAGVRVEPVTAAAGPGEMSGGLVEALVATVADPGLLGALFAGLGGWAAARASTRRTRIRVKVGDREVELEGPQLKDPEGVVRRLTSGLSEAP